MRNTLPAAASVPLRPPSMSTAWLQDNARSPLVELPNFLPARVFEAVTHEIAVLQGVERSYIPTHKQGGTVGFSALRREAPRITRLYGSESLHSRVSVVAGCEVRPTPSYDQSSLSLLIYDRPGDRIGWHFDRNFYRGRHFTLLIPLVNSGSDVKGQSHCQLSIWLTGEAERVVDTSPNQAVLFEGARVRHRVSPLLAGERRVILSMTFCSDSHASWAQGAARRIKDMAYFGVRALWT